VTLVHKWKVSKETYCKKTGEKNPSGDLFTFLFGTGVDSFLKKIDGAKSGSAFTDTVKAFSAKTLKYSKTLNELSQKEKDSKKKAALIALKSDLNGIIESLNKVCIAIIQIDNCTIDGIFSGKHPDIYKKFDDFCKKEFSSENFSFMDDLSSGKLKGNPVHSLYDYFSSRGSNELNIDSHVKKLATALMSKTDKDTKPDSQWMADWKELCMAAKKGAIINLSDTFSRFQFAFIEDKIAEITK
jgi:hypothetical protein